MKKTIRHQKRGSVDDSIREEETNNLGTSAEHTENKKPGEDAKHLTARDELKEELQVNCYKVKGKGCQN
jgi:hypothetical protein